MTIRMAALIASAALFALPAMAQERSYNEGPVWTVAMVQTKPGHFRDYMHFIDTQWKAEQESGKKLGLILDYKVLSAVDPRDNEPDLYLMVEYKNMAAFDTPPEVFENEAKKIYGSLPAADKAGIDREAIRSLRGELMTRELILK